MFEHIRRQAFGKDVGLLELRVDLLNVNSISSMLHIVFAITSDVLAKPVYLAVVELRARRTVSGFEVGESQSTIVVFPNRCGEFGDNILRDTETFGDRLGELPKWKHIAHGSRQGVVLGHHGAQGNSVLQLAGPDDRTAINADNETSSTFHIGRIGSLLFTIETHKVAIHVGIHLERVGGKRFQNQSLLGGSLEVLTNSNQSKLMTALWLKGKSCSLAYGKTEIGSRMAIEIPQHPNHACIVKRAIRRFAQLVLSENLISRSSYRGQTRLF